MIKKSLWYKKIPTFITICNSLCGFFAILYTLTAYQKVLHSPKNFFISNNDLVTIFSFSSSLILLAMVFDACDGWLARKLKATSLHGMHMDSLCDMVTFGVAPAVIVAIYSHIQAFSKTPLSKFISYPWLWFACSIYIGCAALRLASYNIINEEEEKTLYKDHFQGLPTPAAAGAICSIFFINKLLHNKLEAEMMNWIMEIFLPFYMAFIGFMMNSKIPYLHVGKSLLNKDKKIIIITLLSLIAGYTNLYLTLITLISFYIISGPVVVIYKKIKK